MKLFYLNDEIEVFKTHTLNMFDVVRLNPKTVFHKKLKETMKPVVGAELSQKFNKDNQKNSKSLFI